MSIDERNLPPGPNPREAQMIEKDQRRLRAEMEKRRAGGKDGEEWQGPDQAEGERGGERSRKVRHTPDQAEGDRATIDEELRDEEGRKDRKKPH